VSIYFVEDDYLDKKKWEKTTRMKKNLLGYKHMPSTQIKNSSQDTICFKGHFIVRNIGIQKYHCLLLWTITIYGASMQRRVLSLQVWAIARTIVVTLEHVVRQCGVNSS
jgi:hypothetical protein